MDDDVRGLQLHQVAQPVVPVDDPAVEVVQVGRGEAAALQRDERAQVRRDHGQHLEDHPLRAGPRVDEALDHLQALRELLLDLLGAGGAHLLVQLGDRGREVHLAERVAHGLAAHLGDEGVVAVLVERLAVLGVGEELLHLERRLARVDHHVVLVVDHALERAGGHVEEQAEAARHALKEPDVGDRDGKLDVAHPLAADPRDRHLDAAAVAHDVLVLDPLVLAAGALVVAHRPEYLLAEQAARLGLEGAVVDRLRVLDLSLGPFADRLRRGDGDRHAVERALVDAEGGPGVAACVAGGFCGLDHGVCVPDSIMDGCGRRRPAATSRTRARRASGA